MNRIKKNLATVFKYLSCVLVVLLAVACVRNPDGSVNHSATFAKWLKGDFTTGKGAATMTLPEFLKEAMNPENMTTEQRMARVRELDGKTVSIILPQNLGTIEGEFVASNYTSKKNPWDLNIWFDRPEGYRDWPIDIFIKAINDTPGMKIKKIWGGLGTKKWHDYYLLECEGRQPVVLTFEEEQFFRALEFAYDMPANKRAIQKRVQGY